MKVELFPFQKKAVNSLRVRVANALNSYRMMRVPQVVSLQAPTGSGKTIIMAALIEDIYFGTENFAEQPDAIFVWLSDSPALNEQSKQKIDLKADRIRFGQCVIIEDASFDMEELEDGHIYFLNTQKLSATGNLGQRGDRRTYTIWQTLENTAKNKADRLYFIIDEAHRGMQGREAGIATSIMQRFLKGSPAHRLSPMPVVIGMSATSDRFNRLVGDIPSTLSKVVIHPNEVRASGLLKDRILITYPDDPGRYNDMAV
ncbi:MAG: DEAD/DEAH box helicase family protein, partial [Candidatus Excrementavichristensenella sp.]